MVVTAKNCVYPIDVKKSCSLQWVTLLDCLFLQATKVISLSKSW